MLSDRSIKEERAEKVETKRESERELTPSLPSFLFSSSNRFVSIQQERITKAVDVGRVSPSPQSLVQRLEREIEVVDGERKGRSPSIQADRPSPLLF